MILIEGTLLSLDPEVVGVKSIQYQFDMLSMLFFSVRKDKNVININYNKLIQKLMKNSIHQALKSGRGIGETKGHDQILK